MRIQTIFLLTFAIAFSTSVFSQTEFNDCKDMYLISIKDAPVKFKIPEGTTSTVVTRTNNELKREEVYITNYDDEGRFSNFHTEMDVKGSNIMYSIKYNDDNTTSETFTQLAPNGKTEFTIIYEKNKDGKIISQEKISDGKIKEKNTWTYSDDEILNSSTRYAKGGGEIEFEWKYRYDEEARLKKTELYNSKNELDYEWIYDQNIENKYSIQIKNTTQICTWEEDTKDYHEKHEFRFDDEAVPTEYIWRYDKTDNTICEELAYGEKNKLIFKNEYYHSYEKPICKKTFANGKIEFKSDWKYIDENADEDMLEEDYPKNGIMTNFSLVDSKFKMIEHHLFIYNEEGFLTRQRIYNDKNDNTFSIMIKHKSVSNLPN